MSSRPPIETPPDEDPRDLEPQVRRELIDLIASGEAVALVGAGLSIAAGYPLWPALLQQLARRANALNPGCIPTEASPEGALEYAQAIRREIEKARGPEAYQNELGRIFSRTDDEQRRHIRQVHRDLVALPFRGLLTTNYDSVLECALHLSKPTAGRPESVWVWKGPRREVSRAIRGIAVGGGVRHVIHLHGYCEHPDAIVLAAGDYTQAYGIPRVAGPSPGVHPGAPLPPLPEVVRPSVPTNLFLLTVSLLATRRVVFVGFSLDDPFFTEVLTHVCDALWEWGTGVHFAVLPFEPEREQTMRDRARALKETMGIETVFYPVVGGDHSELGRLLAEIRAVATLERPPAPGPAAILVEGRAAKAPEWVNQHNAAQLKRIRHREG